MPEYLSPGVYVEEIDAGPKPIEGVSTSTAGAVGVTALGPTTGKPVLVTSFAEFTRKFGGFLKEPSTDLVNRWANSAREGGRWWLFPLSVKGFFDNGGQRLYVKRVFAGGGLLSSQRTAANSAQPSTAKFERGVVSEIESDAAAGPNPPSLKVRHLFGIQTGTQVTLRNGQTGLAIGGNFSVTKYDPLTRRLTLDIALPPNTDVRASRGDLVVIKSPAAVPGAETPVTVTGKALGKWGDDVFVRSRPVGGSSLALLHDPGAGGAEAQAVIDKVVVPANPADPTEVTVKPNPNPPALALDGFAKLDHVLINGVEYEINDIDAANNTFKVAGLAKTEQGTVVQRLRRAFDFATEPKSLRIWGASQLYENAIVEFDNGAKKEIVQVTKISGDVVTLSDGLKQDYYEGHKVRVIELEITIQYRPDKTLQAEEVFSNLRITGEFTDPSYVTTRINEASELIQISNGGKALPAGLNDFPIAHDGSWMKLEGGDDNENALTVDDFAGIDGGSGNRTGIQALEDIDEISICIAPNVWSQSVQNALIQHCESLKDRFAIIDPKDKLDIEGIRTFREPFDTKYAALYYPWIEVRDPIAKKNVQVAPSAHMAGIYARVDVERGVHKAPANEVVRGITKIADDVTKREQDMLNPRNINVLRFFPGRGNRVWGARVVTSDAAWKYINVRRLFIYVEESIDEGTQWVVFEPNDEPLWARVRATITNFLISTWRSGALQGAKPDEAFFVKCDRTTMTQDDIDNGRLICLVGIAPVKPAEFVIFRIQQKTLETKVS